MLISSAHEPAPPETDLAGRLRLVVTRLSRRLRQQAGSTLSPSQAAALATIARLGPITPSELAEAERIQRPTATRVAGVLESAGLIGRRRDESDRRVVRLETTADGRRALRRLRSRKTAYLAKRLERLDAADIATLEAACVVLERLLEDDA
ncbi:MAG TPA: MarR family transcriptional regulator [Chloroflexota bacterium]|nr:MarR family transcriptional regulator [Chloroflexota bacterium]